MKRMITKCASVHKMNTRGGFQTELATKGVLIYWIASKRGVEEILKCNYFKMKSTIKLGEEDLAERFGDYAHSTWSRSRE